MRAKGRRPTSAIAPPASIANNKFKAPAISNFHCRDEDVNRADPFLLWFSSHSEYFCLVVLKLFFRCNRPFLEIVSKLTEDRIAPALDPPADTAAGRGPPAYRDIERLAKGHGVEI